MLPFSGDLMSEQTGLGGCAAVVTAVVGTKKSNKKFCCLRLMNYHVGSDHSPLISIVLSWYFCVIGIIIYLCFSAKKLNLKTFKMKRHARPNLFSIMIIVG